MTQQVRESILIAVDADTEHLYQEYLRIVEVCKLGEVSRTLHRRVRKSLRFHAWHVVHCEGVDPAPLAWLTFIAKLGVNLRSIRLVSSSRILHKVTLCAWFLHSLQIVSDFAHMKNKCNLCPVQLVIPSQTLYIRLNVLYVGGNSYMQGFARGHVYVLSSLYIESYRILCKR